MPLISVTGISGSGKSAVFAALRIAACEAHDGDIGGFRTWRRRDTNEEVVFAGWPVPLGWHHEQHMPIDRRRVEALLEGPERTIFLGGSVENELDVWDLFDAVVCLVIDDATVRERLASRSDGFGKAPDELARILAWNRTAEANYRRFGATIIDATQPLDDVVADVLRVAEEAGEGR